MQFYVVSDVCNVILLHMFAMLYCFKCLQCYIVSDACSVMLFQIITMLYCFRCLHCHVVSDVYNVILFQMFTMLYCFRCLPCYIVSDVCIMNGKSYTQGQQWYDGCRQICVCDDGVTGHYTCNQRYGVTCCSYEPFYEKTNSVNSA